MSEPSTYASEADALAALRGEFPGRQLDLRVQTDAADGSEPSVGDPDRTVVLYEVVGIPDGSVFVRRSMVQGVATWTIVRSQRG